MIAGVLIWGMLMSLFGCQSLESTTSTVDNINDTKNENQNMDSEMALTEEIFQIVDIQTIETDSEIESEVETEKTDMTAKDEYGFTINPKIILYGGN